MKDKPIVLTLSPPYYSNGTPGAVMLGGVPAKFSSLSDALLHAERRRYIAEHALSTAERLERDVASALTLREERS